MPTLVHLADEREAASIRRNGIKIGKYRPGIYCMPVLKSFFISHQWLRELKRGGVRTFVGIYFKVDSSIKVYAGKYNTGHKQMELGQAIKEIESMTDPLGYEIIIDRKIEPKEIHKIKTLPQNIGWRYQPAANGQKPCACDYCIKGTVKANRIRVKYDMKEETIPYDELLKRIKTENDVNELERLLNRIGRKKRKGDPMELVFLLEKNSMVLDRTLALVLANFRHKNAWHALDLVLKNPDATTREFAADSLSKLYGKEAEKYLKNLSE